MAYLVRFEPEIDACTRCKREAYKNEENSLEGYKFHIFEDTELVQYSPIHPPTCRCKVVVLGKIDDSAPVNSIEDSSKLTEKSKKITEKTNQQTINDRLQNLQVDNRANIKKPWQTFKTVLSSGFSFILSNLERLFKK